MPPSRRPGPSLAPVARRASHDPSDLDGYALGLIGRRHPIDLGVVGSASTIAGIDGPNAESVLESAAARHRWNPVARKARKLSD